MNPYNFSLLLFTFGHLFVGLFILFKRRDQVGLLYFIFTLFVTIWGSCWSIVISDDATYEIALLSSKLAHGSAVFIGITWYHTTLIVTHQNKAKRYLLLGLYMVALFFSCFVLTPLWVLNVRPMVGFVHYTNPGPFLTAAIILFCIEVFFGFFELVKAILNNPSEKVQLLGFFIAAFFGFLGGTLVIPPVYGIPLPQYGLFLTPIYPFVMVYFMMRHRLFDLETIIQVFQREKLATIGLLAASVNHEIRNPLYAAQNILDSYIENEKEGLELKNPIEISKKAKTQIARALDVITKLNRFAKPFEETKDSRQKTQANIQEAFKNVLDLISYEFQLDKIRIINQIDSNLPLIQADQRQLEEILFNLIVNACHAMKESQETEDTRQEGVLTISCHSRESGNLDPRLKSAKIRSGSAEKFGGHSGMTGKIQITITDTGSGISKDQMRHLFEPFHTTKGEKGTGLGLYITKQLVERNGGKISVKSEEGKGTSFILELKTSGS